MISGPLVPVLVALYLLAVLAAFIYVFVCLARITGALQSIAASSLRIEMRGRPSTPDGPSRGVEV